MAKLAVLKAAYITSLIILGAISDSGNKWDTRSCLEFVLAIVSDNSHHVSLLRELVLVNIFDHNAKKGGLFF